MAEGGRLILDDPGYSVVLDHRPSPEHPAPMTLQFMVNVRELDIEKALTLAQQCKVTLRVRDVTGASAEAASETFVLNNGVGGRWIHLPVDLTAPGSGVYYFDVHLNDSPKAAARLAVAFESPRVTASAN